MNKLKKLKKIRLICILSIIPLLCLIGATAPKSTAVATIFAILLITAIITEAILNKKIKYLEEDLRFQNNVKQAIKDSKQ